MSEKPLFAEHLEHVAAVDREYQKINDRIDADVIAAVTEPTRETLKMLVREMNVARERAVEMERKEGRARNDLLISNSMLTMMENEVTRLSKRPDVWSSSTAEAFWHAFNQAEALGAHGTTENTYKALIAAMRAQGYWK